MEDGKIVDLYWRRSEEAIDQTQKKYDRYLNTIAFNILADQEDSRESVNDTYLAAWNSIPPHRPDVLQTYLAKLTRRIAIDCFRSRTRLKRGGSQYAVSLDELEECLSGGNTTEDAVDAGLLSEAIGAYLKTCSREARTAFVGRYYYMDSLKDVAAYCGMTESKAKSLLHRTRLGLREYLRKEGFAL